MKITGVRLPRSPRRPRNDVGSGFTFIELLVVITIIGVIFAAGIVSYTAITKKSRDTRRKADVESIRQSLELCRSLTGVYPATVYDSVSCSVSGPILLSSTPLDPKPCGADGKYTYSPNIPAGTYTLTADCIETGSPYVVTNP